MSQQGCGRSRAYRARPSLVKVMWILSGLSMLAAACATTPEPSVLRRQGPLRPPPKPGDSITKTVMCSCMSCEPNACCRELEKDAPAIDKGCSDGYDFSKCQTQVQSCEGRCFQQRWRTRVEVGCDSERPKNCCNATADF